MKKFLVVGCILACGLIGCKDPYATAVKVDNDVAAVIAAAEPAVTQLADNGDISAVEAGRILDYLNAANTLDGEFGSCIQIVHAPNGTTKASATGYAACGQQFLAGLQNPTLLADLQVTNPASQAKVMLIANSISLIITVALAAGL